MLKRLSTFANYLRRADPIYRWKFSKDECPRCGNSIFVALQKDPFMTRCLKCRANVTNLSLIPVIKNHFRENYKEKRAYELSTYGSTLDWLRMYFEQVYTSEYFPGRTRGEIVKDIQNEDIQNLTFEDESFDVITSNQVFEHVPDDVKGYAECYRVLRRGGSLIFSVPLYDIHETEQVAYLNNLGEVEFFHEPEYHDSRLEGAKSAPVFWHHSLNDIADRVKLVGFHRVELIDVIITSIQYIPSKVVYGIKK